MFSKPAKIAIVVASFLALFFLLNWIVDSLDSTYRLEDLDRNGQIFAIVLVAGLGTFGVYRYLENRKNQSKDKNGY